MIRKRKTRSLKTEIIARSHQWCAPASYAVFFFFFIFCRTLASFDLWAVASVGRCHFSRVSLCSSRLRRPAVELFARISHHYSDAIWISLAIVNRSSFNCYWCEVQSGQYMLHLYAFSTGLAIYFLHSILRPRLWRRCRPLSGKFKHIYIKAYVRKQGLWSKRIVKTYFIYS